MCKKAGADLVRTITSYLYIFEKSETSLIEA